MRGRNVKLWGRVSAQAGFPNNLQGARGAIYEDAAYTGRSQLHCDEHGKDRDKTGHEHSANYPVRRSSLLADSLKLGNRHPFFGNTENSLSHVMAAPHIVEVGCL